MLSCKHLRCLHYLLGQPWTLVSSVARSAAAVHSVRLEPLPCEAQYLAACCGKGVCSWNVKTACMKKCSFHILSAACNRARTCTAASLGKDLQDHTQNWQSAGGGSCDVRPKQSCSLCVRTKRNWRYQSCLGVPSHHLQGSAAIVSKVTHGCPVWPVSGASPAAYLKDLLDAL